MNPRQSSSSQGEIETVVTTFYKKAVTDTIIGYHFRHIDDFSTHIPKIVHFWKLQLVGPSPEKNAPNTQLIKAHIPLGLKKGELGRWVVLFEETLETVDLKTISKESWRKKIAFFKDLFLAHPKLLGRHRS
ncbi:MAG: hypothetical protein OXB88_05295 [Bacteriovoracales bacterium]|nr:hypothetical protein [Bacteriovoracales bacterium]